MNCLTELPESLNRLKNPVKKLYFKGDISLLNSPKIAIVGSRKCSNYTRNLVRNLAATLKKYGICVVSGAAIGTDIAAHEGAFPHTIAVFGNGLDKIYPMQNIKMISQIYENALALSEYEPDEMPTNWSFLERNRIVIALSKAVVIAEAALKSGSMSSARLAQTMNIPIFVLPQRFGESDATNLLLAKNQANLIADFDEFALQFAENFEPNSPKNAKNQGEDEVINFIKNNQNFDEIYKKFGDRIYEYELDGKIAIDGVFVRLL